MKFFIMMFVTNLLIPLIMLLAGFFMYKYPPKQINSFIGYRSGRSRKNKDTWAFAHDYCGRLWIKLGSILLIPSILVQIPFIHASENTIRILAIITEVVQSVILLGSFIPVEIALARNFDKDGKRKEIE